MKDSKNQLIQDTLAFLKQEGLIQKRVSPSKPALPPKPTISKQVKPSPPPPPKRVVESKRPLKTESPLLMDAIRKHLPHIALIETIPQMQSACILFEEEEQLPFLENLKQAIEGRFCCCTIAPYEMKEIESFFCLLTPKDRGHPRQILLAKGSHYRDNIEAKRALWTQICQKLSPKSS